MNLKFTFLAASLVLALTLAGHSAEQPPVPELPRAYIDTAWHPDPSGKKWEVHTSDEFKAALKSANPGDTIVLDASTTYEGNFELPLKENSQHRWIYIVSSALSKLPPPGTRINPDVDAVNMPKIVTPNSSSAILLPPGASFYRLGGLEVYSSSKQGCQPANASSGNCFSWNLIYAAGVNDKPLPDSLTIDRCYIHGSPTQDVRQAVFFNGSNMAIVDSWVSDIHQSTSDSQAVLATKSPGPIKIVNNYLSASTENVMFGGGGGYDNPYVPSDIEIRNNFFFKPLDWAVVGITVSPKPRWTAKNLLEFKSAQRVLVDSNMFENSWASGGQGGAAILFTVRTSQSGNIAVIDDVTFSNNILKNVTSGFVTLSSDFMCGKPAYAKCTNKGSTKRIKIDNNLILFRDPKLVGGARNVGLQMGPGMSDFVLEHNSFIPAAQSDCWNSIYFAVPSGMRWPPPQSINDNVWILNNSLCRPPTGDWGAQGTDGLKGFMGDPAPLAPRYAGNVMFIASGTKVSDFPAGNVFSKAPAAYVVAADGKFSVTTPGEAKTTDHQVAGVDVSKLANTVSASFRNAQASVRSEQ